MKRLLVPIALISSLASSYVQAELKPLWEAGLGAGAVTFPDYRGSDETKQLLIPVPYFVYRGKYVRADREGMRGILFDSERVTVKLSGHGTIPVDSENNEARNDMPDLSPTVEIGPSVEISLWTSSDTATHLDLRMPLRAPFTIEKSPESLGWVFLPKLNLDLKDAAGFTGWNVGLGVGPVFAGKKYHNYFYGVEEEYATEERPTYRASSGYSGLRWTTSISKRFRNYWFGAYMRYDSLSSAVFEDSPLVRQRHSIAMGLGFTWIFSESPMTVDVPVGDI